MKRYFLQTAAAAVLLTMLLAGCGSNAADDKTDGVNSSTGTGSVVTDTGSADPDGDGIVGNDREGYDVDDGDNIIDDAENAVDDAAEDVDDAIDDATDGTNNASNTAENNPSADKNAR